MTLAAAALTVLFLASSPLTATAASVESRSSDVFWHFPSTNTADLPDICPMDRYSLEMHQPAYTEWEKLSVPGDADLGPIDMLLSYDRDFFPAIMYFIHTTRYYERRQVVQEKIEKRIAGIGSAKRSVALGSYAMSLVYFGEFKKAVELFGPGGKYSKDKYWRIDFALAQAYFRLGDYKRSLPYAQKAWEVNPAALDTRWQNMLSQLGLYGKDIFKKFSMKGYSTSYIQKIFPKDWPDFPFEDVTKEMGLDKYRWGGTGGDAFVDLDGDGYDDILFERKGFPLKIFKNMAGKSFEPVPDAQMGTDNCAPVLTYPGDYLNNGKPDLVRACCNFDGPGHMTLLKNDGHMTFEDVTKASGLGEWKGYGVAMSWADYDLDGNLDLVVSDWKGKTHLYHNNGDGTFEDVTKKAGIDTPPYGDPNDFYQFGAMTGAWGDYDGDGYPDLFLQGWGWKRLYHNNGDGTFTDVTEKAGLPRDTAEKKGYYGYFVDYDNDGKLDLLVGQYVTTTDEKWGYSATCVCSNLLNTEGYSHRELEAAVTLYHNNGDGTFSEGPKFLPLGVMGYQHADWNNTGWKDFLFGDGGPYFQQAEPFLFYENNGGTFTLKTPFTMLGLWGKGHGASFADYDHDGQMDLILNNGGAVWGDSWPSMLLHNKGNSNHWITIGLKSGQGTNGSAIGAKVRVYAGSTQQLEQLRSGGAMGTSSFMLHFGLGKYAKIDKLVVEWPNRKFDKTELHDVDVDQAIQINEADGTFSRLWKPAARAAETVNP
jgi:tetratricopeptide (TPR) repeat protein